MVTFDCTNYGRPPKLFIQSPNGEIGELGVIKDIDLSVDEVQVPYNDTSDYISNSDTQTASMNIQNKEEVEELIKLIEESIQNIQKYTVPSYRVICTTKCVQNRTHKRKRINKKWAKRYGYTYYDTQPYPIIKIQDTYYMTHDAFDQFVRQCKRNGTYHKGSFLNYI